MQILKLIFQKNKSNIHQGDDTIEEVRRRVFKAGRKKEKPS
jgi:hypothetical protein